MLEIRALSKSFGGVKATDNVTLDFADGSLTAVIGPNGAGKSTFFNLITGALRPDSGQILLNGVDMAGRSPPEIVRHGIGRAFQVASIFPSLTVQETMLAAVGADQRRASVLHRRFPLAETRDRAEHAMELLGLASKRNRIAATLSHGDQKLLDIALALVLDPKVLLLDEPTAGMGTEERWRMIDKVRELWETQKITVVFIEHDMDIVFKIAPEIVVLCYGRILATGTPDAIRRNEAVIEAYLGTEHHAGGRDMSAQPVVQVEDLDVYYGTSQILFGVGLSVRQGETMALLGRNGAGKSTTMKAIMGLAPARRGKVTLRGRVVSGLKPYHIARAGLGFVPEDRQIFPEHTVEDNLVIGAKKGPNGEDEWSIRRIYDVFPLLEPLRHRIAGRLSGGEQQMLAIARTLMGNPALLLLDEPSEGLAPIIVQRIGELLRQLRGTGATVLIAEQNMHFCLGLASHATVIDKGQIVYTSGIEELKANDNIRQRYLAL